MRVARIGIDLAKNVFQIHRVDERDIAVIRKTLRRDEVGRFFCQYTALSAGCKVNVTGPFDVWESAVAAA